MRLRTIQTALRGALYIGVALAVPNTGAAGQSAPARQVAADTVPSGSLSGVVRSRFDDQVRPLGSAVVEIVAPGIVRSAVADSTGRYAFSGLPAGAARLRASHTGHTSVTLTVVLSASSALSVDVELEATPLELPGIDVSPERYEARLPPDDLDDPVLSRDPDFEMEVLELGPGLSEAGISEAVGALPGQDPADPTDVLFMRGSTTDLKLVLLDGVPVATPFHIGGLLPAFEPGVLASAGFHVGGAPARYDGGLTHVLDLRTRTARRDRARASASVDLLSSALALESPLGSRAGVLASARSLHDLGQAPLGGRAPYGYTDLVVSMDAEPRDGHGLRATGFWNSESVRLSYADGPTEAEWGNAATSLRYDGDLGGADLSLSIGGSRYDASLPLRPSPTASEPDPAEIIATTRSERLRVVAEARWGAADTPMQAGISFEDLGAEFTAEVPEDGLRSSRTGRRSVAGAFADVARVLGAGVRLRAGLRADVFERDGPRLSPRLSLTWELGPAALLTVATGRYHQVVQTVGAIDGGNALDLSGADLLPVALADHVVLSLDQRLGSSVGLGLDGYWKRFQGAASSGNPLFNSGIDVRVRSGGPRATAWLGYGLSWYWETGTSPASPTSPVAFAGRHLLSAGASGHIAGPVRGEVRVAWGAGLPSTGIPFGSSDGAQLSDAAPVLETLSGGPSDAGPSLPPGADSFLRLDVEVHADFHPEWGGHRWRLRPYLRLLNPLDRRDALFYAYQPGRADSVIPLTQRPVLPVFGIALSY